MIAKPIIGCKTCLNVRIPFSGKRMDDLHRCRGKTRIVVMSETKKRVRKPKPCPFCGSDKIRNQYYEMGAYNYICKNCGAKGPVFLAKNDDEASIKGALTKWNGRF